MSTPRTALVSLVLLAACGPGSPGDGSAGGSGDSGFASGSTGHDSTSDEESGASTAAESSSGSTGLQGSEGSTGDESTEGTTGEPMECVLPHSATLSWCAAARGVAQALDCAGGPDPQSCYQAVAAQYAGSTTALLASGDCDPASDPAPCPADYQACTEARPGSEASCLWEPGEDMAECATRAGGGPEVEPFCDDMNALYVLGCSVFDTPYQGCDQACALPCTHGFQCLGPALAPFCTIPCMDAAECPLPAIGLPICDPAFGSGICSAI